jgi:hypothetical protein
MNESEAALNLLMRMIDDIEAQAFFSKGGPLAWFSLQKTGASACLKGALTEKQIPLIRSVYREYVKLKLVSQRFSDTAKSAQLAAILYRVLHDKPKLKTKEDRSRSQRMSKLVRAFHNGVVVHIGHFNDAEFLVGELRIQDKIHLWEEIHSARRVYLAKLYEADLQMEGSGEIKKEEERKRRVKHTRDSGLEI